MNNNHHVAGKDMCVGFLTTQNSLLDGIHHSVGGALFMIALCFTRSVVRREGDVRGVVWGRVVEPITCYTLPVFRYVQPSQSSFHRRKWKKKVAQESFADPCLLWACLCSLSVPRLSGNLQTRSAGYASLGFASFGKDLTCAINGSTGHPERLPRDDRTGCRWRANREAHAEGWKLVPQVQVQAQQLAQGESSNRHVAKISAAFPADAAGTSCWGYMDFTGIGAVLHDPQGAL